MIRKIVLVAGVVAGAITLAIWDTQREVKRAVQTAWRQ